MYYLTPYQDLEVWTESYGWEGETSEFGFYSLWSYFTNMNTKALVKFWSDSATRDIKAMDNLFVAGNYDWALFLGHLVVEKILKARWIVDNKSQLPPKTHSLDKLARGTKVDFNEKDLMWLVQATDFNLEARYPDYKMEFYKRANKEFAEKNISKVKEIYTCILKALQ